MTRLSDRSRWSWMLRAMFVTALFAVHVGCAVEKVAYHDVPEWQIREGIVPDRYVDEQGVTHIYRPRKLGSQLLVSEAGTAALGAAASATSENAAMGNESKSERKSFHALMPEQVIGAIINGLAEEDYDFLYEHVLANETRRNYEQHGGGAEGFKQFMATNRDELYAAFNRMRIEIRSPAVVHEQGRAGAQRVRFHRHYADQFEFSAIDMIWEGNGLKLLMIHPTDSGD